MTLKCLHTVRYQWIQSPAIKSDKKPLQVRGAEQSYLLISDYYYGQSSFQSKCRCEMGVYPGWLYK